MNSYVKNFLIISIVMAIMVACDKNETSSIKGTIANANNVVVKNVSINNGSNMKRESMQKVEAPIDVDLTKLSSTMVYSEVYQMIWYPEMYIGKIVKMSGNVSIYESSEMNRTYYTCIIADATACCQQGIEFRLVGDKGLPTNYKEGDEVTVIGEFNIYKEGTKTYCELINSNLC